jgi:cyclopropane fatty-acyl-phospholipid synthase-like methyltransferase
MIGRLAASGPRTVLDIGCGWGELMLRLLAALPGATGTGIDVNEADLARGRNSATSRGLADRVTFASEDARAVTRPRADLVLCLGASHALSGASPPRHLTEALAALHGLVNPGGRVLLGEGFWERPPTADDLARMWPDTTAAEFTDLAGLADQSVAAGFRAEWIETASQDEWDDFESGYQADVQEWLATHDAPGLRAEMDQHRSRYLRGYRGIMGLAYLTLIPDGQAAPR